jgi:ATP/maltotriose-dependent transcriptional regulator MalT
MRAAALRTQHPAAIWEVEQLRAQYEIRICNFDAAIARVHRLSAEMQGDAEHAVPTFQIHQRLNVEIQLAALSWLTGRTRDAVGLAGSAAEHAREVEHGLTIVHCLAQGVVWTLFQCGEYEAVLPHIEALREAIYRHGIAAWVPVADTYAVAVESYLGGKPDPARLRSAFYGVRAGVAQIRHDARYALIADAMIANCQADDAAEVIAHVLNTSAEPWCRSEFLRLQAAVERMKGRSDDALRFLHSAFDVAQTHGSIAWTLRAAIDLAAMLQARGNAKEAARILRPVYQRFAGELETRDLRHAQELLDQLT